MKNRYLRIFIITFIILFLIPGNIFFAQPIKLKFKQLTTDDGLSTSIVSTILQDYKGFIWVGTPDGLNRYDSFKFVVYKNNTNDPTSLCDNIIQTIFEDSEGNLFIGSEQGLSFYDRDRDSFKNFMFDESSPLNGIDCTVNKIVQDSLGNLWLGTNKGLIYYDRLKRRIKQYIYDAANKESLNDNNVESVLIDSNKRLWVATRTGLNIYLPGSESFKHFDITSNSNEILSSHTFRNLIEDKDGNLWVGGSAGLFCLTINKNSDITNVIHYKHDEKDLHSLSVNLILSLFVDDTGNLWIGTDNGGINLFDKNTKKFWHYRKDDYDPQSITNEAIESIYQDRGGNLWFGTYTGGLNIAVKNMDAIIKYQNLPGAPLSLSHNTVNCFLNDKLNNIWIGTDGGGLNLFDNITNRFKRFNTGNSNLSSNAILCMIEDSKDRIWLGTWAGGLVNFDPRTNSFKSLNTKNSRIIDDNILALAEGDNDDLWLGTFEHGLVHYEINKKKFIYYTPENSGIGNEMVVKILKLSEGKILIGTTENLQIFYPSENRFITYSFSKDNNNSLSYPRVTDILPENDTCIWIGTPKGLNRFNPVTGSFVRYYDKDGLPNNFIDGLVMDESGILWVTTNGGVCRFDYKAGKIKNFIKADGLQSNEFSERGVIKTKNGELLMGGTRGFNIIRPEKITENNVTPDVLITDLKIFNKSVKPGTVNSPLTQNITDTKSLVLSRDQSVLTFSFAVMDFSAPEKNQYAYMMENFDKDWIYPGNKAEATYTNLNPGKYIFRVRGSNNDGLWNETATSISITILPPWWNTWWFRLIGVFVIVVAITSFFLLRVKELYRQRILLEKKVDEKTVELIELNASKDKFFSIIAHDLKNPFNTIIGFSEILKIELESGHYAKSGEFVRIINSSAVQTFRLLENLLEWANSQQGNVPYMPEPIHLNDLLKEESILLADLANVKSIELKCFTDDSVTVFADKNMLKTVLRNLISNAIKFTPRHGKVEVNALHHEERVEISISDNGIGMTKETISKLFRIDGNLSTRGTDNERGTGLGLILCREFVEKHGGKIQVESKPGQGSVFKVLLPSAVFNLA